jgi:hypothetical protein
MTIGRIKKHPGASKIAIVPLIIRSGEAPQLHAEVAERLLWGSAERDPGSRVGSIEGSPLLKSTFRSVVPLTARLEHVDNTANHTPVVHAPLVQGVVRHMRCLMGTGAVGSVTSLNETPNNPNCNDRIFSGNYSILHDL